MFIYHCSPRAMSLHNRPRLERVFLASNAYYVYIGLVQFTGGLISLLRDIHVQCSSASDCYFICETLDFYRDVNKLLTVNNSTLCLY